MGTTIDSDKVLVKQIFENWYCIPEYQRPYVWENDQVTELLDDVYNAALANKFNKEDNQSQYYLGSLVLQKNLRTTNSATYVEYDVLDGQQRLITLLIITSVIRDLTKNNESRKDLCKKSIYQMAIPDDNIPERQRIVFETKDKVKEFIDKYVKEDGGTLLSDDLITIAKDKSISISIRNMANAIVTVNKYFTDQNSRSVDIFFKYLRSNVLLIYVATKELEDAFHLFTVMNNRGMKLRNSDILKADNLKHVQSLENRTRYAKLWEQIEERFAEDFDNFLSHLRTILVKQKAGYKLLKEFEDNVYNPKVYNPSTKEYEKSTPLLTKGSSTFEFIKKYYDHYINIFDNDNIAANQGYRIYKIYNQLVLMQKGFEADYWIAPVLKYYDTYGTRNFCDFLVLLEKKFSADWIIGLTPTDRIDNINKIIKEIETSGKPENLFSSDVFQVDQQELVRVLGGNIYGKKYAKYILLKHDAHMLGDNSKLNPPDTISIEHILPQKPDPSSQWCKDFSDDDREKWTNRLGNLILLSRRKNTSLSNDDYSKKREKYFKGNVELFSNSVTIWQNYLTWGLSDLMKNHEEKLVLTLDFYGIQLTDDQLRDALK